MFQFAKNLEPGRPAEIWFHSLTPADQTSWDIFYQVFSTRWPLPAAIVTFREELMGKLKQTRLEEADIGAISERDGDHIYAHVVWTEEIRSITDKLRDTKGHLITMVQQNLPLTISLSLPAKLDTWPTFLAAIASISLDTIADRREHEETIRQDILQTMGINNTSAYNVNTLTTRFTGSTTLYSPNCPIQSYAAPAKAPPVQINPATPTPPIPNMQRQNYAPYSARQGYTPAQQWVPCTPATLTNQ
jgi:predicted transcriptional regulator YheO